MRRHDDIGQRQQPWIDLRFELPHIEPGAGELFLFQCFDQCLLVDDAAARRVDEIDMGPHQANPPPVDESSRCSALRGVWIVRMSICPSISSRSACHVAPSSSSMAAATRCRLSIMDGEPKARACARHGLADASHADDAKRLAPDPVPEHARWTPADPFARSHQLLAFG